VTVEPPLAPRPPELGDGGDPAGTHDLVRGGSLEGRELGALHLDGAVLHDVRLRECRLRGTDLGSARAAGLQLADVVVTGGSWANLDAPESSILRLDATGLRGTGAQLRQAALTDCSFVDCRLDLTSFRHARLERVAFRDCRLEEADFYGVAFCSVLFQSCVLNGASVEEATFERCELRSCELQDLAGVGRLSNVRMPWPDVVQIAGLLARANGIQLVD
jgi:uncharacterized protein YjbI with pentapeptide repeats